MEGYYGGGEPVPRNQPSPPQDHFMRNNDAARRAAVEDHHPGQYPPEDYEGEYPDGEEYMYDEYDESGGEYPGGNLHTS